MFLCYDCLRQHSEKIISFSIVYRYIYFIGKSLCNLQQSYFVFHSGDCLRQHWNCTLCLPCHCKYHGVLFLFLCYDCLRQHSGTIIAFGIIYRYLDFICKSVYKLLYFYLVLKSGDCLRQHWYCTLYFTLEIQISCEGVFCFSAMTV